MPQIYQETAWLLFQMIRKGKHGELQGSCEHPSGGGPDSQKGKKCSQRKGGNKCTRQKAF